MRKYWKYQGNILKISSKSVEYIKEISRKHQRNIKEISKKNKGVAGESTMRVNSDQLQGAAKEKSWQGNT